jgi:hypothetical protein
MEGYYTPVKIRCEACAVREREAGEQHGHGVLIGVVDESYHEGYEPRLPVAVDEAPRDAGDPD